MCHIVQYRISRIFKKLKKGCLNRWLIELVIVESALLCVNLLSMQVAHLICCQNSQHSEELRVDRAIISGDFVVV